MPKIQFAKWKQAIVHILFWLLLAAALFYGLHRYFEFRERQLDERLELLSERTSESHLTQSNILFTISKS